MMEIIMMVQFIGLVGLALRVRNHRQGQDAYIGFCDRVTDRIVELDREVTRIECHLTCGNPLTRTHYMCEPWLKNNDPGRTQQLDCITVMSRDITQLRYWALKVDSHLKDGTSMDTLEFEGDNT